MGPMLVPWTLLSGKPMLSQIYGFIRPQWINWCDKTSSTNAIVIPGCSWLCWISNKSQESTGIDYEFYKESTLKKWLMLSQFCKMIFKCIFLAENLSIFIQIISLNVFLKVWLTVNQHLFNETVSSGNKPLPEPMKTQFVDAYIHRLFWMR